MVCNCDKFLNENIIFNYFKNDPILSVYFHFSQEDQIHHISFLTFSSKTTTKLSLKAIF